MGTIEDSNEIGQRNLVLYRNALAGSNTGGIAETQDMVDFCARNKIAPEIVKIPDERYRCCVGESGWRRMQR